MPSTTFKIKLESLPIKDFDSVKYFDEKIVADKLTKLLVTHLPWLGYPLKSFGFKGEKQVAVYGDETVNITLTLG